LFGNDLVADRSSHGDHAFVIRRDGAHRVLKALRDDPVLQFDMLMDLGGSDRSRLPPRGRIERFEVAYNLYSVGNGWRLRVCVPVPEADPRTPSVRDVWKAADWAERECWDMFGIRFDGHPNLKRILCHHEFVGHPLRKDYDRTRGQWLTGLETL